MNESDRSDLERAIRHCRAALRALEAANRTVESKGAIYPTHLYVGAVELATATQLALALGLRHQEPASSSNSQKR